MPSKGKRVAARQSSLRRRRGSGSRPATAPASPAGIAAANAADNAGSRAATATATATAAAPAAATASSPAARPAAGPAPQTQRGRRFERPAAYNYVGSELARIGIFSAVLLAALIAISFAI